MRNAFVKKLTDMVLADERVCILTGDMGNNLFTDIIDNKPKQFINCGISEAAMVGMAAGLSSKGYIPFIYSIAPFVTSRVLEQIKIDLCYNEFPATIIGLGAGLSYGALGPTHHSLDDIAILRAIPNLNIYLPSCSVQLVNYMDERMTSKVPTYIRLGRNDETKLLDTSHIKTGVGEATLIDGGNDALIITAGPIVNEAYKSKDKLKNLGIYCSIVDLGTIRPIDSTMIKNLVSYENWYILEEHGPSGISSIIIEELLLNKDMSNLPHIKAMNTGDSFIHRLGSRDYLLNSLNLDADSLTHEIYTDITHKRHVI